MWEREEALKQQRRKGTLIISLTCGPLFTLTTVILFMIFFALPQDLQDAICNPDDSQNGGRAMLAPFLVAFGVMCPVADRLAKKYRLSTQEFSGAAAFSCAIGLSIAFFIVLCMGKI